MTIYDDIQTVFDIITTDSVILSLGFTPEKTYAAMTTDELILSDNLQMFIYHEQTREIYKNNSAIEQQIQIDISAPISKSGRAMKAADRIVELFNEKRINNNFSMSLSPPSPCASDCISGFYTMSVRFSYATMK